MLILPVIGVKGFQWKEFGAKVLRIVAEFVLWSGLVV
jgi:hypothetical protein